MPTVTTIHYGTAEHAALVEELTPRAADPGPLPDPWPGMIADVEAYDCDRYRVSIAFTRIVGDRTWVGFHAPGVKEVRWSHSFVHEVRTATGEVLWRRA